MMDEKNIASTFKLSKSKIGRWVKPSSREDAYELEQAAYNVAEYVFQQVNKLYDLKDDRVSFLTKLKLKNCVQVDTPGSI